VVLGGAAVDSGEYRSTRDVLLAENQRQLVVAFNRLVPKIGFFGKTHDEMANDVRRIVSDVVAEVRKQPDYKDFSAQYSVVGHSMGGKIALLLAAKFDIDRVLTVVALDPVDDVPVEIVSGKVDLNKAKAKIHLTRAEMGGNGSPAGKNADAIRDKYPDAIASYTLHRGAGHFSYTDNGGGLPGLLVSPKGDAASNAAARHGAHELVKLHIGESAGKDSEKS
jgi:pimeloyl-ACP methyl ester carboxylesterase